jgi:electron transport complex protein RnfG
LEGNRLARLSGILSAVCVVVALVLGLTYNITKPIIAAQADKQQKEALKRVVPGADTYGKKVFSKGEYYECLQKGMLKGYAIYVSSPGYSGDIKMLLGIDKAGMILGVEVLSQSETPGLGARCVEVKRGQQDPWFPAQFKDRSAASLTLGGIETITGSTITSKAILDGLKTYAEAFLEELR